MKKKLNPIPTAFSCMGTDWTVKRVPDLMKRSNCMGQTNTTECEIVIDDSLTGDQMFHTYYHELMHVVASSIGRQDLNADEAFIDLFAGLLYQINKTSTFE